MGKTGLDWRVCRERGRVRVACISFCQYPCLLTPYAAFTGVKRCLRKGEIGCFIMKNVHYLPYIYSSMFVLLDHFGKMKIEKRSLKCEVQGAMSHREQGLVFTRSHAIFTRSLATHITSHDLTISSTLRRPSKRQSLRDNADTTPCVSR